MGGITICAEENLEPERLVSYDISFMNIPASVIVVITVDETPLQRLRAPKMM